MVGYAEINGDKRKIERRRSKIKGRIVPERFKILRTWKTIKNVQKKKKKKLINLN